MKLRGLFLAAIFLFCLTVLPAVAEARVFDLTKESFASYLVFTHAPSSRISDNAVANESTATSYSDEVKTNISGEFGFVYATKAASWRFGFEILKPAATDSAAKNSSGATVYNVKSDILGYIPKIGLEVNLLTTTDYRLFLFGYAGQGSVTVTNTYSGLTIAPNADFTAKYKGNASSQGGGFGAELAAFDTTSIMIEVGYRTMSFTDLVYSADVTAFNGAHAAGDAVKWTDGKKRELDFTGGYVSFGARWWIF